MLMDGIAGQLSVMLGASPDQIKLILLLFLSVPLSLLYPHLPSSNTSILPHLVSFLPSVLYLCFILDLKYGFLQLLVSCLITWVIVDRGVKNKEGKSMCWKVFTVVMGHLAINHLWRHFNAVSLDIIEITGSQMVLCMKLISFAWSVYDGHRAESALDPTQKSSKIDTMPGLIPFLGYCFFFPSILAGPSFTYASYISFTSRALFIKEKTDKSESTSDKVSTIVPPGRRRKATKRLLTGVVYLGIYSVYSWKFGFGRMLEGNFREETTFGYRLMFLNIAAFVARTKYYAVWCIAESAFILAGIGYNPRTTKYDASRNVRIRSIELAPNFKILLDSWNMNTNVWLRECIYKRVPKDGKKPGFKTTQTTFITSALWHGVNPCYLLTFILGGFCQSINRSLRTNLRPLFLPPAIPITPAVTPIGRVAPPLPSALSIKVSQPSQTITKWIYDILGIIFTQLTLNFIVVPFMVLNVSSSIAVWSSVNYYALYFIFGPFIFFNFLPGKSILRGMEIRRIKNSTRKEGEKQEQKERVRYEKAEEEKRVLRGEGVPSLGMEIEELFEPEDQEVEVKGKGGKKSQ